MQSAGERLSKESGDVARDNYLLGQIFERKIEYEKAYEHFEEAVKFNPENPEYLSALNLICAKLRK